MEEPIVVHLELTRDKPNSMDFTDTYSGLNSIWYEFEADSIGNVTLRANAEGFEHLARYFFKMARSGKMLGYHAHHPLEFGDAIGDAQSELTIIFTDAPPGFFGPDKT